MCDSNENAVVDLLLRLQRISDLSARHRYLPIYGTYLSYFGTCTYTQKWGNWEFSTIFSSCMNTQTFSVSLSIWISKHSPMPWWRHQMETFSALLAICAGNSPVPDEFTAQRPVTRSFDFFICTSINGIVNNREAGDLRRHRAHYDVTNTKFAASNYLNNHCFKQSRVHYHGTKPVFKTLLTCFQLNHYDHSSMTFNQIQEYFTKNVLVVCYRGNVLYPSHRIIWLFLLVSWLEYLRIYVWQ